jgi:GNAT superfamily N-acetyltransferase
MEHEESFRGTLVRLIGDKRALCVRGEAGAPLSGGILLSKSRNTVAWLAVAREMRGQGLGSVLLAEGIRRLDPERPVTVRTFAGSVAAGEPARRLYGKFGFRDGSPAQTEINPGGVETVLLERPAGGDELA